jgi:chemotaxis protein CheZ
MPAASVDKDLEKKLEELRQSTGGTVRIEQVGEVVQSLLSTLKGDLTAADLRISQELEDLALYIRHAKAEIAQLRPQDIQDQFIPSATDELDAIVEATESATNDILDAVEKIESLAGSVPEEASAVITETTTRIYEACNFQDITGQRIGKVVKALRHIEDKVQALVLALGGDLHEEIAVPPSAPPPDAQATPGQVNESDLLNGPQLKDKAKNQAEIDALFSGFD